MATKVDGVADAVGGGASAIVGAVVVAPFGALGGPAGVFSAATAGAVGGEAVFDGATDEVREHFPTDVDELQRIASDQVDDFNRGVDVIGSGFCGVFGC